MGTKRDVATAVLPGFGIVTDAPEQEDRGATFSGCGKYRYALWRIWNRDLPLGLVGMVNPSTADARVNDNTITNLTKRARFWGWGGYYVVNVAAHISPHPEDLLKVDDPFGPDCDAHIARLAAEVTERGGRMVVAWGSSVDFDDSDSRLFRRDAAVLKMLTPFGDVFCIARHGKGSPTHPLARGKGLVPIETPLEIFVPGVATVDAARVDAAAERAPKEHKKVLSLAEKPLAPEDMSPLGSAPMGPCAACSKSSEGRYGLARSPVDLRAVVPLCNACGPSGAVSLRVVWERLGTLEAKRQAEIGTCEDCGEVGPGGVCSLCGGIVK